MLKKVVDQVTPSSYDEWVTCVYEVEAAKNRPFNGFSPSQRQIGMNIRIPGSLGGDDKYDAVIQTSAASSDMQRLMRIKEAAQEAFIKHTMHDAVQKAVRARSKTCPRLHSRRGSVRV